MGFGLRYWAELRSKYKGVFWRVEIAERGYSGASEEMLFEGSSPLEITWEQRGDEFYVPVKGSEATINIECLENFHYINLFTSDPRKYRVSIFRNTKLYWRGYVVADLYSEKFTAPPYEVSIKAVDGFSLLSSVTFVNLDNTLIEGRKSVWELLYSCVELLELDVDVVDWMDLYADGMDESLSPLRQVYVDLERFYAVESEPTYRDVLELCLRPFAGQIFQSNGALHIRRTISLYNNVRPMSFYSVGSELPSGWLVTADGENIVTANGEAIITDTTRERIESIWEEDINVQGDSTLDIVPPLREVSVGIKNKLITNIFDQLDIYNLDKWTNPTGALTLLNDTTLRLTGDSDYQGEEMIHAGCAVQKCSYTLKLEYTLKCYNNSYRAIGGSSNPDNTVIPIEYGFKVVGEEETMWLSPDGVWSTVEAHFSEELTLSSEESRDVEVGGFPIDGLFQFYIRQTLEGYNTSRSDYYETLLIGSLQLEMDAGDDYDSSLSYSAISNTANNVDMLIELPIADIPYIPNDNLIYSLYFTDSEGTPTRMWYTKGGNDYNTLVNHLVVCALKYRQLAARRISGEMFTGKHIDMNTVVQDDKYLHAGFYVNSIELKCLEDSYDSELVEMPGLLLSEEPPEGDDCIEELSMNFSVRKALLCVNKIIMLTDSNAIYAYDTVSKLTTELLSYSTSTTLDIFPADNAFTVVDGDTITVVDYRGVVVQQLANSDDEPYHDVATFMNRYIYRINSYYDPRLGEVRYKYLTRPDYPYTPTAYSRGDSSHTYLYEDIVSLEKSFSTIVINTESRSYIHDCRVNDMVIMSALEGSCETKSISDYFICLNYTEESTTQFRVYRRDSLSEMTMVKAISGKAECCVHNMGEVAYSMAGELNVWEYRTNDTYTIKNLAGSSSATKALLYIGGELYIVKPNKIFKLCRI